MTTDIAITEAAYPTPEEVHATLLSNTRYGYAQEGVTVNVSKGSDLWQRTKPMAGRLSLAIANGKLGLRDINPLRVVGDALVAFAGVFGVTKRPATKAAGYVIVTVLTGATSVTIPAGYKWSAPNGKTYEADATTTVSTGSTVAVTATAAGKLTDQAAGTWGTWDSSAVAFLSQRAKVGSGGLDGGADTDDDETLRARLLRRLSFPRTGGNWAQVADLAEGASASIALCVVYPTARGPGSYDAAIVGDSDDPVLNTTVQTRAHVAVVAEMPGSANLNLTSIIKEELDVIVDTTVPLPVLAGGVGGGWADSVPWPSTAETGGNVYAEVTGIDVPNNTITVNSTSADPPKIGDRFAIRNPTTGKMVAFAAVDVTGGSGAYVIELDSTNMSWIVTGMYCSAWAENLQTYADLFLAAMQALGPGEKSDNPDILQWARRKPSPEVERPHTLTSRQLSAISSARGEVSHLAFAGRFTTATKTTQTTPSVPPAVANSPRMLALKHLSFRRQV